MSRVFLSTIGCVLLACSLVLGVAVGSAMKREKTLAPLFLCILFGVVGGAGFGALFQTVLVAEIGSEWARELLSLHAAMAFAVRPMVVVAMSACVLLGGVSMATAEAVRRSGRRESARTREERGIDPAERKN